MDDLVKLEDICKPLLGVKYETARRQMNRGELPIPAFRTSNSRRGPIFVRQSDIDAHIQKRRDSMKQVIDRMADVT